MIPAVDARRVPPMRTRRLVLRPLSGQDAAPVAHLAGDWDVARMTARIPYPYSLIEADAWIATIGEGEFVRGIELQGALIGACGYVVGAPEEAEIGYWIGKPWWGNGYATEAAEALIAHCFAEACMKRLTCCHYVDNLASARVIAKLGFHRTGLCRTWCEARQEEVEAITYERRRPWTALGRRASP